MSASVPSALPPSSGYPEAALTPFPDRLGPVMVKELRQGLRAHRFVIPFLSIHALCVFAVLLEYGLILWSKSSAPDGTSFEINLNGFVGDALFYGVVWIIVAGVMPLSGLALLQSELNKGNVELLLMSDLSRWQIVRGKWLVQCLLGAVVLVSLVPYFLARYFMGQVELTVDLFQFATIALWTCAAHALVIGVSGYRNLIGRLAALAVAAGSFQVSYATTVGGFYFSYAGSGAFGGGYSLVGILLAAAFGVAATALYVCLGLQLGRARLRIFENPLEPPASGLIMVLLFIVPLLIGLTAVATGGMGSIVTVIVMTFVVLAIDPGPGKKKQAIPYAQP